MTGQQWLILGGAVALAGYLLNREKQLTASAEGATAPSFGDILKTAFSGGGYGGDSGDQLPSGTPIPSLPDVSQPTTTTNQTGNTTPAAVAARNWGANPEFNQYIAALTGYEGDFGAGKFQAWLNPKIQDGTKYDNDVVSALYQTWDWLMSVGTPAATSLDSAMKNLQSDPDRVMVKRKFCRSNPYSDNLEGLYSCHIADVIT